MAARLARLLLKSSLLCMVVSAGCDSDTTSSPGREHGPPDAGHAHDAATPPPHDSGSISEDAATPDAATPPTPSTPSTPEAGGAVDGVAPGVKVDAGAEGGAPEPSITLIGSEPRDGARNVPRSAWIRLSFSPGLPATDAVRLDCEGETPAFDVDAVGSSFVINPRATLPPGKACSVTYEGGGGVARVAFDVAPAGAPAVVAYDRNDATTFEPFPDDFYLIADSSTRTGVRVDVRVPSVDAALKGLFQATIAPTRSLDGMSPLAPIAVALPGVVAADSVPRTASASLDPLASLGLFDIDAASPTRGQRVPFNAALRDETNQNGSASHVLLVFPSTPLRPRGHYAFVVTARAMLDPTRPLEASPFFQKVAAGEATTTDEVRLQGPLNTVLSELALTSPPLRRDDLALALGITVRSVDDIPNDLLEIRRQIQEAPPPAFTITSVVADSAGPDVAAIVQGTWSPLRFTEDSRFLSRDDAKKPRAGAPVAIPFTLALPKRVNGPAPIIIYAPTQPGHVEDDVPYFARSGLARAGFAVIGFTDIVDREIAPDSGDSTSDALATLLAKQRLPDYLGVLGITEQLSLLRMIPSLAAVDVLPVGAPDGQPELDPSLPLGYFGYGHGAQQGCGLLAFAPEIHAAELTEGAGRFASRFISGFDAFYGGIVSLFPTLKRAQLYGGLALLQMGFDEQDSQNLARYVYRSPLSLGSSARASIRLAEGLDNPEMPVYAVRSGAAALGIPLAQPHAEEVPFLPTAASPVRANIDASTSAALVQFVPKNYPAAPPTPSCLSKNLISGFLCAGESLDAHAQRAAFFTSALGGVPAIFSP